MPSKVELRTEYSASEFRQFACQCDDVAQSRRLLALAAVVDGMNRTDAARVGGMDRQTLRDWVHRFNEEGLEGLKNRRSPGAPKRLTDAQLAELTQIVEQGPDPDIDGVVRWRRSDLVRVVEERFGVVYAERTMSEILKKLGFSHISTRPKHPGQASEVVEAFKKNFPALKQAHIGHLPRNKPIEIWFQDEARIGQKNGRTRQWAKKGTRPTQPADQRYGNAYLFGAICPARGVGAGLVMPYADTEAMQHHINEISTMVKPGAHALVIMDRASWHTTPKLDLPRNITPVFLPSRAPELNPVENVWQFLRQNWISNRILETYDDILDVAENAWKNLTANPLFIQDIGMRDWAHVGQS